MLNQHSGYEFDEARIHWQCRRGMLELDLMLQSFLRKRFAQLSERHKQAFVRLLESHDQILLDYLMGQTIPADKDIADVARQIRDAAGPAA